MTCTATVPAILSGARPSPAWSATEPWLRRSGTFKLDDWTAAVGYAVDGIFCHVVATLTPDPPAEGGAGRAPVRFAVTLAPGERHTITMARPTQTPAPAVLAIAHTADALSIEVVRPAGPRPTPA